MPINHDGNVRLSARAAGRRVQTVYCTVDVSGTDNVLQVPLNIRLSYVYLQHIEKQIVISI